MEKKIHELFNDNILTQAALRFGTTFENVKKVGGFENFIFEYQKDGVDYILRISHTLHRSIPQVISELDFVNYLAQNNANVSIPVFSVNNLLVEAIYCEQDASYFMATSYVKAKGTHVRRDTATDEFFINYGRTLGKFHQLTKNYRVKENMEKRYEWYNDILILEAEKYLPKSEAKVLLKLHDLIYFLKKLPKDDNNYGLIHTDVHMGNFFIYNSQLTVFDFDDCAYQYFVSDIAIALFYYIMFITDETVRVEKSKQFLDLFMKGYQEENQLDYLSFQNFGHFLKLRELILYIVVYRSLDLEKDEWGKRYVSIYKDRIINDIPFVNIDFTAYYNPSK